MTRAMTPAWISPSGLVFDVEEPADSPSQKSDTSPIALWCNCRFNHEFRSGCNVGPGFLAAARR